MQRNSVQGVPNKKGLPRAPAERELLRGSSRQMAEFQIRHPYHSQGLAAGGSALLDAINRGKVHLAKFILDAGEYDIVNTRDFNGKTPLIRACYIKEEKTRDKAVSLLLRRGADVNLRDDVGRTACAYACLLRCNDVIRILVKNNVNPDIADNNGNTPLIISATVGNDVAIEILIRSFRRLGLNVNHVNGDGQTALLVAATNGFVACASLLAVDGRANVSRTDPETGKTAEQLARDRGCSLADVLPFSVAGGGGGGGGGKASSAAGRGAFWAVKTAWSSTTTTRFDDDGSGTVNTEEVGDRDDEEEDEEDEDGQARKGCRAKKGGAVDGGGIAMEEKRGGGGGNRGGDIGRFGRSMGGESYHRMLGGLLHQRSSSLPSLRIGFERLPPSPFSASSSAAVQPSSTSLSLGSSSRVLDTSAAASSQSTVTNDEDEGRRRSPGGLNTEQGSMKNGGATTDEEGQTTALEKSIPPGLDDSTCMAQLQSSAEEKEEDPGVLRTDV